MSESDEGSGKEAAPAGGRNLVICCDGTANEPRAGSSSNVFRLVKLMRGAGQDNHFVPYPDQQVYYDPGLGTESSPSAQTVIAKRVTKVLGLAVGYGLRKNIVDAYTYLMNHYQQGDRIYMFGFSRGAYTVRAVAGMLETIGLLERGSENLLYYAIRQYDRQGKHEWADIGAFKGTLCRRIQQESPRYRVPIHFLGVWDTVKSIGILRPSPPYTATLANVVNGRHAVALDEKRSCYRNHMWSATGQARGDCQTVWFSGVHSDVGGSYAAAERGLADITMKWMMDAAQKHGLEVDMDGFDDDRERRQGKVRLQRAQELAAEGQGRWKELAAEGKDQWKKFADELARARSWTRKLEKNYKELDENELKAALEDDVAERFERIHNPLLPYWWVLGWWRRRLPDRAWVHRSVVRRMGRMKENERRRLKSPLDLLTRLGGGEDVQLVGSVLLAQRRRNGQPGDVLIQTLNQHELDAIRPQLPLSAEAVIEALWAEDIKLWRETLSGQSSGLSEKEQEDLGNILASIEELIAAGKIKGEGGAFAQIEKFFRKKPLTRDKRQLTYGIIASAPYLVESLAESPWPEAEAEQE